MVQQFKSLRDHVYEYISEEILEDKLKPDERINETALANKLSISRSPVREALIQLSCEGILENIPRKGFVLSKLNEQEAVELYTVIGALDALAAKVSCDLLTEQDFAMMEYYIGNIDSAINIKNYSLYLQQQDAFHSVYLNKSENAVLSSTITSLKNRLFTRGTTNSTFEERKQIMMYSNDEHREILNLFKARDKEGLQHYIADVHWSLEHAHNEIFID